MSTLLTMLALAAGASDERIEQRMGIVLDERGDARIEVEFQLTARQWNQWKSSYGDHPDLLRRDLTHSFPAVELSEYTFRRDDVNRRAVASVRARGGARYKGAGKFEVDIPASWSLVTSSEREWHFSHSENAGQGVLLVQTVRIVLPDRAAAPRLGEAEAGQRRFSYEIRPAASVPVWPLLSLSGLVGLLALAGRALRHAGGTPRSRMTAPF